MMKKGHITAWSKYFLSTWLFCISMFVNDLAWSQSAELSSQTNKTVSLKFQQIDVRRILTLLAEQRHLNLVVGDEVSGKVSLNLEHVTWEQALQAVMKSQNLAHRMDGQVLHVFRAAPNPEPINSVPEQTRDERERFEYRLISVHYAQAKEVYALLTSQGTPPMLSESGSLHVDNRTNGLLVFDDPKRIQRLEQLVDTLDVPMKQVLIEARIVTLSEGELEDLGVRWGILHGQQHDIGGSLESLKGEDGVDLSQQLSLNLPSAPLNSSSIAFQVAKLGANTLLDLELSALQRESKAEIISSPRLLTTNKKPAFIEQGTEIPYLEAAASGATSVSFRKAVLSLKVTPQITPDNRLILDLNVTQDRPGETVTTGTGGAVAIQTQRIGTQIMVNNGETIVLGGIYQHSSVQRVEKVPLLGDLPILGALFRRSYQQSGKNELFIFVTPKVFIQ
ncbi:type IV pilus secretin PilQ [Vibrio sp. CAIM 722]|uniref:Type IV pilus secretin PilQ n=1 Tax=Vibrio eleionomae TaxID=2653505 RepID=A0A7X4RTK0_9VIBR|nr:type IV pilus secretin PilQ [Vibrio eleionomae]MZI92302.1 type IV pilus secretin PilQ [Vibrio eleionomae]